MERAEAIEKLKMAQRSDDTECAHSEADTILCDLLISLGYDDVVQEFVALRKWYA